MSRRSTPGQITFGTIRCCYPPRIWSITGKIAGKIDAELTVGQRRCDGILKIVDLVASDFAPITKVDPGMRILVHEKRYTNRCVKAVASIAIAISPQGVP